MTRNKSNEFWNGVNSPFTERFRHRPLRTLLKVPIYNTDNTTRMLLKLVKYDAKSDNSRHILNNYAWMQYSLYNKHFTTVFTTVLRLISLLNCPIELVFGSEARLVHSQLAVHCRDSLRACLCLNRVKKRDFTTYST